MASGDGSGSSWWGSLLNSNFVKAAKEKSMNAIEIMKTDLAEFTSTMTSDTNNLLSQATAQLKEISTQNLNSAENVDDSKSKKSNYSSNKKSSSQTSTTNNTIHDRFKQELESLQSNETTYLTDPDSSNSTDKMNEFTEWKENFNPDSYKSVISNLLIENSSMRLLYSQLVPAQISNVEFWSRYFFKVNQLEEEHKKRIKLLERASKEEENTTNDDDKQESLDWGDDEDNEVKTSDNKNLANDTTEESKDLNETLKEEKEEKSLEETPEQIEQNLNENKPETDLESESADADKINESNIEPIKKTLTKSSIDKLETSQKTEDSDEWEKVAQSSDESELDAQSKTDKTTTENKEAGSNKNSKQKEQASDDWDNWDE